MENEKDVYVYEKLTEKKLREIFKEMEKHQPSQDQGGNYYWLPQHMRSKFEEGITAAIEEVYGRME